MDLGAAPASPIEAFVEAVEDARVAAERDHGIRLRWIYDIPGEFGLPAAEDTLGTPCTTPPDALIGFGLGGPEVGVRPAAVQADVFDAGAGRRAAQRAARRRDHGAADGVGRAARPRRRADRPRHLLGAGPRAARPPRRAPDPARGLPDLQHRHPRGRPRSRTTRSGSMYDAGVLVTVNSDDPPMFGTTLNREYEIAADLLDLDEQGIAELARTAVRASFMPDAGQGARWPREIDAYAEVPVRSRGSEAR